MTNGHDAAATHASRIRRSCLAVPGSSERMLAKAATLEVDEVFLDLEDAVAPAEKPAARELVAAALRDHQWGQTTRTVRVNAVSSHWTHRDVTAVLEMAGAHVDCLLLPKVQEARDVHFADTLVTQLERDLKLVENRIGLEIQIEDARGLAGLPEIVGASPRIEALVFGPGDMAAAFGMPSHPIGAPLESYPGDHWHAVLVHILTHARAAGLDAVDGPYARIDDPEGFRSQAMRSRALGFDGKMVLHPSQIPLANDTYGVSLAEFERATDLLDAYTAAVETDGVGAVMFGSSMIDEASRRMARRRIELGRRIGLETRPTPPQVPYVDRARWRARNDRGTRRA